MLSNPLLADVVETHFVPLMIKNNAAGEDAKILKKFKEPAWNYQVVRFIGGDEKDIIPRKDKVWTTSGISERIAETFKKQKKALPETLKILQLESDTQNHRKVAFAMHCFWTGEMKLGQIDGVVNTEAGWHDGREVTLVTYHGDTISLNDLVKRAAKIDCAHKIYLTTEAERKAVKTLKRFKIGSLDSTYKTAKASDQKKQLSGTAFSKLKLTPMQSTKVNAFARVEIKKAQSFLTAKQIAELKQLQR